MGARTRTAVSLATLASVVAVFGGLPMLRGQLGDLRGASFAEEGAGRPGAPLASVDGAADRGAARSTNRECHGELLCLIAELFFGSFWSLNRLAAWQMYEPRSGESQSKIPE